MFTDAFGFRGDSAGPAIAAYADVITNGVTQTSLSDTINIGAAPTGGDTRHVICFFWGSVNTHRNITACSIGGVTATKLVEDTGGNGMGSVWMAEVPTGTTAAISASFSGSLSYSGGVAYTAKNLSSVTPISATMVTRSTSATRTATSVDAPKDGLIIAAAGGWTNVSASFTWSDSFSNSLSEDADANVSGTNDLRVTGASANYSAAETGQSITSTCTTSLQANGSHRLFVLEMR